MQRFLAILPFLLLLSCSLDELRDDFRPAGHKAFCIEEAKEFFEKDYMELLTRSQAGARKEKDSEGSCIREMLCLMPHT